MQITEQIIERISRKVFNTMFSPALRQSNVVMGGSGSSVSWADNAGHANIADEASTAGSATSATTAGSTQKVTPLDGITYGAAWLQYKDKHADQASNPANAIGNPTGDWYHHIVMNHGNSGGYFVDMALCFHSNAFYYRRIVNGTANDWVRVLDSSNSSVSKDGSTLTVKINDTEESLTDTNTWRPVVNNLSSTDTDKSLSAAMGKDLYDFITTLQGYFDANGNAKSALKLTTVSKTAWGKTFWTSGGIPASISGDMTSVGDISFSDTGKKIGGFLYFDTASNRLGVNESTPLSTLHVGGAARFAGNVFPTDDYATTEYTLGLSEKRWSRVYAHYCELYGTAAACHVGTSSSARISLHWASGNNRGLYDSSDAWVIGTDGTNTFLMRGNIGLGTTSPGDDKLKVNGSICTTVGLYSEGYVDGLAYNTASDKRLKDIIDYDAVPHIDDIANAPAIHFTWKNKRDEKIHVGSIAQYWQKITPECVHQSKRRFLTMNYDVIALVNTIALAREVNALKHEIAELKNKAQ
jgi:hypothetical protein